MEGIYLKKGGKELACGYTTGTCAAAAAQAAAVMYFTGRAPESVSIMTPKGIRLTLEVLEPFCRGDYVSCAIRKESGDDPDITNGVLVYAGLTFKHIDDAGIRCGDEREGFNGDGLKARNFENKMTVDIDGGKGVGRVTKAGLEQPVGAAAINSVPRRMITDEITRVCEENDFVGHVKAVISIPEGEALAQKTFNPRLGIEGGISVLGTSGIVEPMSERALIETIRAELSVKREENKRLGRDIVLAAPGNYGRNFVSERYGIDIENAVKCSNYIGELVDLANELGFKRLLLAGHIGKLVKVSGGIMNTHSSNADARLELLAAHALMAGADAQTGRRILACVTAEEALGILREDGLLPNTMDIMVRRIKYYLDRRSDMTQIEVIVFSNEFGELAKSAGADDFAREFRK